MPERWGEPRGDPVAHGEWRDPLPAKLLIGWCQTAARPGCHFAGGPS